MNGTLQAIGIYQIGGGIAGLSITAYQILASVQIPGVLVLLCIIVILLYVYSIYAGILLLRNTPSARTHSLIVQYLQLIHIGLGGFKYKLVAGLNLGVGLDITNNYIFTFNFDLPTFTIILASTTKEISWSINLLALFIIRSLYKHQVPRIEQNTLDGSIS